MKIFRNRTVIGVLCILLALIICFGVTPLFSRSASEKTEIVRVTKDIKEGDEITAEMVQTVEVGAYNLPQNLMTDKKEVVGKYATADLAAGDYILSSKLSAVPAAENAYLYNLDGTKQAISVTIKSFAVGLSGKLESGDIVTVIVADYQGKGETAIPPELQYVEVISVTASSGYDANTGEVVDEKELPSTVTLLVTTEQAKVCPGFLTLPLVGILAEHLIKLLFQLPAFCRFLLRREHRGEIFQRDFLSLKSHDFGFFLVSDMLHSTSVFNFQGAVPPCCGVKCFLSSITIPLCAAAAVSVLPTPPAGYGLPAAECRAARFPALPVPSYLSSCLFRWLWLWLPAVHFLPKGRLS